MQKQYRRCSPIRVSKVVVDHDDLYLHIEGIPYAHHYNLRCVYFLLTFWSSFMYCDIWPYVWLVLKSGFRQERVIVARVRYI